MHRPIKIVILGDPQGGDNRLLKIGLEQSAGIDPKAILSLPLKVEVAEVISLAPDAVFVTVNEDHLYTCETARIHDLRPCTSIQKIWDLIEDSLPVHALIPNHIYRETHQFTGLDTLALCLSGVAGVWVIDQRLLGKNTAFEQTVETLGGIWRRRAILLSREIATQLYDFQEKIINWDWPTAVEGRNDLNHDEERMLSRPQKEGCFTLAMGIATLSENDLKPTSGGFKKIDDLAYQLYQLSDRTGYWTTKSVISKHLGYLERGWNERVSSYEKKSRNKMPLWSREEGFPKNFPLIRKCPPDEIAKKMYAALEDVKFERDWEPQKADYFTTIS